MTFDLEIEGKRVLVAGGTKGVGAAVAAALRDAGAVGTRGMAPCKS